MDDNIGRVIDSRYRIRRFLGRGATGYVYSARDLKTGEKVALKLVREDREKSEKCIGRFLNEGKAISLISHPNVVSIYELGYLGKIPYIVMEFVEGTTLRSYEAYKRTLRWTEAVYFLKQILGALAYLHGLGVWHRDIRPHNVMLKRGEKVKIADFGISRFPGAPERSVFERSLGAIFYLSPEQAQGDPSDHRADIYSVGVLLYEMVTGRLPFRSDRSIVISIMHMKMTPVKPREWNASIPENLERIILRAMEKNPNDRYQSAEEMLEDVKSFEREAIGK